MPFVTFWEDGETTRLMIEKLITEPFLYVKKRMVSYAFPISSLMNFS
jgi:hypothetical protein